jgi:hypothetical protein
MFLQLRSIYVSLVIMKRDDAASKRAKLLASLPPLDLILRGSLLHRTIRHKKGCQKCALGGGHSVYVLTIGYPGGRTKQFSIRPELKLQVTQWLKNYRQLKAKLEAICEFNHAFLRPEE